ncbi:MAG: anthranilate synthase component I [Candidatus Omnitrophota bacterium]
MYTPSLKEFLRLSKTSNVIPVYKEISADLDTPVSSFLKVKKNDYAFLLESVEGQEKVARYSFLGSEPSLVFKSKGKNIEIIYQPSSQGYNYLCFNKNKKVSRFTTRSNPLAELKNIMADFKAARIKGLPRFYGGFVGFMGYDMVRFFERIPDKNPDDLGLPDCVFMLTDTVLAFDHINHTIKIICNVILPNDTSKVSRLKKNKVYQEALKKIESIHRDFDQSVIDKYKGRGLTLKSLKNKVFSNFTKSGFCSIVNKAKEYIRRGDIIQVVLSQRFRINLRNPPFDVYRRLRGINPSPYMFFLKLKDFILIGSSPEMLVRCEGQAVETRPIAGTRRRGKDEKEDKLLEQELFNDKKERAEHLMLVDLGRNDLGRISQKGKVKVNEFMNVERYSHVMHLVSDVTAELDKKYNSYDVLKACFPAGTVSGSPKIRAMEIIDELENTRRGAYSGCVGYFSFSGNLDTCITIRTIIAKGGYAYIQAGAGIVLDSVANREYRESQNKARALIEAIISS